MSSLLRVYADHELGADGYPLLWHRGILHGEEGPFALPPDIYLRPSQHSIGIKDLVRQEAGHRCIRCGHPYECGQMGSGEWTPCDELCRHGGPVRWSNGSSWEEYHGNDETIAQYVEAAWRILTVHHVNRDKADCRWWNLCALCQRCHLTIQGKVWLEREFVREHSEWFKPYAAGWYALKYEQREITRHEALARMDELLGYEFRQPSLL